MDSEQRPSTPLPDAPLAGVGALAAGLRAHRRPIVASFTGARRLSGIGDVGRAALRFGSLTNLSQSARRREIQRVPGASHLLVRPPDYWAGGQAQEEVEPVRTGDAAYDALIARRARVLQAAQARPPARRGLPSTVHRRGRSLAGPMTGPGSVVRRLTPAPVAVVPNPATTGGKLTVVSTPAPQAPRRPRPRPPGERRSARGGDDRPGHRAPRLAERPSGTPDAIRTPSFDALLHTVAAGDPPAPSTPRDVARRTPAATAREEVVERLDTMPPRVSARPAGDAPTTAARSRPATPGAVTSPTGMHSAVAGADPRTPGRATRTARVLPSAAVSVHAAARRLEARAADADGVRRLSFARSSALADRSPWDDVRRLPVGFAATAVAPGQSHAAPGDVHPRPPGVGTADRGRRPAASHGIALQRALRPGPTPAAPAARVRAGESLADAVRRAFGDPTAAGSQPTAGRVGPDSIAPVVSLDARRAAVDTVPVAGHTELQARTRARPGTVLSAPTTHAPLARSERAAADRRLALLDVSRIPVGTPPLTPARDPARSLAGVPRTTVGVATSRRADDAGTRTGSEAWDRRTPVAVATPTATPPVAAPSAPARVAAERAARQAVERTADRVTVRRLPSAATAAAPGVAGARSSSSFATSAHLGTTSILGASRLLPTAGDAASSATPSNAGTHIAARLAARAGTGFDLVGRLPVGAPPLLAPPAVASTAAPSRVRRALLLPNARVPASTPVRTAEATDRRSSLATSPNQLARRVAALETPSDAVRRLPVGAPAIVVARSGDGHRGGPGAAALVRRSMALAGAPIPAAGPGGVLPGRRSTTDVAPARRAARQVAPAAQSTADRLRELVATSAFDAPPGTARRRTTSTPAQGAPAPVTGTPGAPPPVAPPSRVLQTAAARFEHVQRTAGTPDRPVALPARFRPLAERIVGPRIAVQVVHGAVTRKALAAAGHEAATTDRTIHLPTRPDASARTLSIVAHELEHVAAPSAVPRFHGGVASPEEARATRTEQVVRRLAQSIDERGGNAATAGTAGLPVAGLPAFGRSGAGAPATPPGPPVPASAVQRSAAASAASAASEHRPSGAGAPAAGVARAGAANTGGQPIRRVVTDNEPLGVIPDEGAQTGQPPALSPAQLSAIIRAVEDRLLEEIERRGGLSRGAF